MILRGFFRLKPDAARLTPIEVYEATNRPPEHAKANRVWLSNRLTHLRHHGFVKPVYSTEGGPRKLEQVELTLRGRRAMRKLEEAGDSQESEVPSLLKEHEKESPAKTKTVADQRQVAIDELAVLVEEWAERHPAYRVNFTFSMEFIGKRSHAD